MSVAITRLKLRGAPERAAIARFAIEDGIRTCWPDDERLVLIRRVALGRMRPDQRPDRRSAQFTSAWTAATQARRHGSDSGAGDANCVWFESRAEAWRLLLRELAAGRCPSAWFWRLAVPDWRGAPAREWLARSLAAALAGEGPVEPVMLVEAIAAEGAIELLLAAAQQLATPVAPPLVPIGAAARGQDRTADPQATTGSGVTNDDAATALVLAVRKGLPERLVATIELLVSRIGCMTPEAHRLLERLLLRASPGLHLAASQRAAAVRRYAALLESGRMPGAMASRDEVASEPRSSRARARSAGENAQALDAPSTAAPAERLAEPARQPSAAAEPIAMSAARSSLVEEAESAFAGLWLVVPTLTRLGFREWLAAHPDLAAADGGRRMVRALARHHSAPADDPALLPFADIAPDDPDFARPWRVGLDFHLWRRAHIRLHDVVRRRGWLRQSEERLVIRFDPESVDLRLRRHALDVDPGWTDWLGLSIRYRYADRGEA